MTFREKSAALTLASLILFAGLYGWRVLRGPMDAHQAVRLLVSLILIQCVVLIIAHILAAIRRRPEALDERDRLVELRGPRNAYFVLVCGVVGVMALALVGAPAVSLVHALMAALVTAEVVRFASQLVYYRTAL